MVRGEHQHVAARKSRWSKIGVCLLASAAVHASVVLLLTRLKSAPQDAKDVVSTSQVKIRIVPATPKTPLEIAPAAKPASPSKETAARPKRNPAKVAAALGGRKSVAPPATSVNRKPPVIDRYDQLFPKAGIDYPVAGVESPGEPDTSVRGLPSFDPENDGIPFATKTRHLSKLTVFAKDLAGLIAVPPALQKLEPSGSARVRFSRKSGEWQVTEAAGDPYFRALLYETLDALSPQTYGLVMLAATEFESVRVHFEFRTISVVDQTTKPIDVTIDGNKIFIVMTRQDADPKWQMLTASPAGLPAVNLLGIGWVLARPYIEADPNADIEVKRLRLSPAFIRPIGR
jgi:hypothetical protein